MLSSAAAVPSVGLVGKLGSETDQREGRCAAGCLPYPGGAKASPGAAVTLFDEKGVARVTGISLILV